MKHTSKPSYYQKLFNQIYRLETSEGVVLKNWSSMKVIEKHLYIARAAGWTKETLYIRKYGE